MNSLSIMEIEKVLDERIRPELMLHNGNIKLIKLENDRLYVRLTGQCMNCPSAELTLENTVSAVLKKIFPQLGEIILITGVSDELIADLHGLLEMRHKEVR